MIGIANPAADITPWNVHLDDVAASAHNGVETGGGIDQVRHHHHLRRDFDRGRRDARIVIFEGVGAVAQDLMDE